MAPHQCYSFSRLPLSAFFPGPCHPLWHLGPRSCQYWPVTNRCCDTARKVYTGGQQGETTVQARCARAHRGGSENNTRATGCMCVCDIETSWVWTGGKRAQALRGRGAEGRALCCRPDQTSFCIAGPFHSFRVPGAEKGRGGSGRSLLGAASCVSLQARVGSFGADQGHRIQGQDPAILFKLTCAHPRQPCTG